MHSGHNHHVTNSVLVNSSTLTRMSFVKEEPTASANSLSNTSISMFPAEKPNFSVATPVKAEPLESDGVLSAFFDSFDDAEMLKKESGSSEFD